MLLSSKSVNMVTGGGSLDDSLDDDQGTEEVDVDGLICYYSTRGLYMRKSVFFSRSTMAKK